MPAKTQVSRSCQLHNFNLFPRARQIQDLKERRFSQAHNLTTTSLHWFKINSSSALSHQTIKTTTRCRVNRPNKIACSSWEKRLVCEANSYNNRLQIKTVIWQRCGEPTRLVASTNRVGLARIGGVKKRHSRFLKLLLHSQHQTLEMWAVASKLLQPA